MTIYLFFEMAIKVYIKLNYDNTFRKTALRKNNEVFWSTQAEEEARALQKKIQTIENELDQTQEALMQVNAKLEEKDKALQNVSQIFLLFVKRRRIRQYSNKREMNHLAIILTC